MNKSLKKNVVDVKRRLKRLERFVRYGWNISSPATYRILVCVLGDVYFLSRCARNFTDKSVGMKSWHSAVSKATKEFITEFGSKPEMKEDAEAFLKDLFDGGKSRISPNVGVDKTQSKQLMKNLMANNVYEQCQVDQVQDVAEFGAFMQQYKNVKGCPFILQKLYPLDTQADAIKTFGVMEANLFVQPRLAP